MIKNCNFSKKANRYLKYVCICLFFIQGKFAVANNTPATAYPLYQDQTISRTSTSNMENDYYKIAKDLSITSFNLNYSVGAAIVILEKREGSYSGTLISSVGISNGNTDFNLDYSGGNYFYLLRVYEDGIGGYTYAITGFNPTSCPTPTVLSGVNASSTNNSVTLSGLSGSNATNHLVVISDTNSFTAYGVEENAPVSVGTVYGGSGEQIIYAGTAAGAGVTITSLSASTTYYIKVYGYEECSGFYTYNGGNALTGATCVVKPTIATALDLTNTSEGEVTINSITGVNFSHSEENGYIIKVKKTNTFAALSDTATLPTANAVYEAEDQVVYVGMSSSPALALTNLEFNTEYYFKVYAYSLCNGTYYIESTGYAISNTTCGTPTAGANEYLHVDPNATSPTSMSYYYIRNAPADGLVIYMNTIDSFTQPAMMTTLPTADQSWNGSGQQATTAGGPTSFFETITSLTPNTTYYYKSYPYSLCNGVYYFNTTDTILRTQTTCNFSGNLVSNPVFGTITSTSMQLNSFTNLTPVAPATLPDGFVIKMNTANSFTALAIGTAIPVANTVYGGSGEQVVYSGTSNTPNTTITGLTTNTVYYFTIYAYYQGCINPRILYQQIGYDFSKSNDTSLIDPIITFTDIVKNAGDPGFNLAATSNSAGTISYQILSQTGSGTILSGVNNETVTLGTLGTVTIEAKQVANGAYNSGSKIITLTIVKVTPTIIFNEYINLASVGALDLTTLVSSNSAGIFSFEIIGDALGYSLSGANNATLNQIATAGSFVVRVTQAESETHLAGQKDAVFAFFNATLNPKTDVAIANFEDFSTDPFTVVQLNAFTHSNAEPITYTIEGANPTGATLVGSIFTAGTPGTVTLRATTKANSSLFNQTSKDITVTIIGTPQTITFNVLADVNIGDPNFNLTATASSGLTVSYVSSNTAVATVSGNTVTIVGEGSTNITASQAGDATYYPASDVIQSLTVNPIVITDQTVSVTPTSGWCSVNAVVSLASSQVGAAYYLRDDADNTIVEGPIAGTGSEISFTSETISATKTYNVVGIPTDEKLNALQFDGVDGYVNIPGTINTNLNTDNITVETWAYIPSSDDTDQYTSLIGQEFNGTDVNFSLYIVNGKMQVGFYASGWKEITNVVYPKDEWIHIAATYDKTAIKLYINGVEAGSFATTDNLPTSTSDWRLGRRWDNAQTSAYIFGGAMAETRIWNVAKSSAEINTNMNKSILTDTGLVASYPYVDGAGTTLTDYSGNGYNGTLTALAGDATNWIVPTASLEMTNTPTVTVSSITDQTVMLTQPTGQSATVSLVSSTIGVDYYLRDNADNSVIEGPISGTGSGFSFATEAITGNKTYNVVATDSHPDNKVLKALSFDGVDDYATIPATVNTGITSNITLETWAYIPASDDTDVNASIITHELANGIFGDVVPFYINISSGTIFAGHNNIGGDLIYNTPAVNYPKDQWFHIAASFDGISIVLYLNGVQVSNTTASTFGLSYSGNWRIGRNHEATLDPTKVIGGKVANTRIWNTIRSQVEIDTNKNTTITTAQSGLILNYTYTETSGSSIADLSGSSYVGTVVNALGDATTWVEELVTNGICGAVQMTNTPTAIYGNVEVSPIVYLQGASLNPNSGEETLMRDDLRVAGVIPTTSPYADALGCNASVFTPTGANAIVDWVWVELRDAITNTTIIASQSALLQRDGDVVATDGTSPLNFAKAGGNYYVVIKHRNHLGIMSSSVIALSSSPTTVDFTNSASQITYGSNAQTAFGMSSGVIGMWAGNVNGDNVIQYTGANPDSPSILSNVLADAGNFLNLPTYAATGYNVNDVNMDVNAQYTGASPDAPFILQNALSHPGNFLGLSTFSITEQLP